MDKQRRLNKQRWRRSMRTRNSVRGTADRPRLSVHRSSKHISAQLIDDDNGRTLASASTCQKTVADGLKSTADKAAAAKVGQTLANLAKSAGVTKVAFDRAYYQYHGRVAALADAARKAGLEF